MLVLNLSTITVQAREMLQRTIFWHLAQALLPSLFCLSRQHCLFTLPFEKEIWHGEIVVPVGLPRASVARGCGVRETAGRGWLPGPSVELSGAQTFPISAGLSTLSHPTCCLFGSESGMGADRLCVLFAFFLLSAR